jgi:hypothetical protein
MNHQHPGSAADTEATVELNTRNFYLLFGEVKADFGGKLFLG